MGTAYPRFRLNILRSGHHKILRWGPRTLDLDLIFYDDLILETPELQIPHPRCRERAFVLLPLAEIAPDWRDPVTGKTILQLLGQLGLAE